MTTLAGWRDVTTAVIALLADAGLQVGDGVAPADTTQGYVVVHPIGGTVEGPLGTPHADGHPVVQLTCVGHNRLQAEGTRGSAAAAVTDQPPPVTGHRAVVVELLPAAARRDDTTGNPALWIAPLDVRIALSPTT